MAIIALVLTAINIMVTISLFRKTAGRVNVKMDASVLSPGRSLATNNTGSWGLDVAEYNVRGIEVAKVSIENPGRIGATITKIELRIEGSKDPDLAVALQPLEVRHRGGTSTAGSSTHRLEPFDEVVYLFDFWQALDYVFDAEPKLLTVRVRVQVKVAGQKDYYTSIKHGYWNVSREWVTFQAPWTKRSIDAIVMSELASVSNDRAILPYLDDLSATIASRLDAKSSALQITKIFQEVICFGEDNAIFAETFNVWAAIAFGTQVKRRVDNLGDRVIWHETKTAVRP